MKRVFGLFTAIAVAAMLVVGNASGAWAWGPRGGGGGWHGGGGGFHPLPAGPMARGPMMAPAAPPTAAPYGGMPGAGMPGLSAQQFAAMHNQFLQQNYQNWNQSLPSMGIPMQQFPQQYAPQYPQQYAGAYGGYGGGYGYGGMGGYGANPAMYGGGGGYPPGYGGGGYGTNGLGGICIINCSAQPAPFQVPTQSLAGTISPFMYYQLQASGIDPGMTGIIPQGNPAYPTGYNFGGVRMSFGSGY